MSDSDKRPHIGAFVLETLTLGMYGEPRHTLREYVQNSYDSIRAAVRTKLLTERGRVNITISEDSIVIRDNGLGIPHIQAYATLTSIGASKKDRQRDAGFRGIGRLAGMAYCDELKFRTTFPGERWLSTVTFDCKKLLAGMNPDEGGEVELSQLLHSAISFLTEESAAAEDHYFEVTLSGLTNAPYILKDPAFIREYLSETAPVEFDPEFEHRERISSEHQSYFGEPIEAIDLFVRAEGEESRIYKHYKNIYQLTKVAAQIQKVEWFHGVDDLYWGWVGYLTESGAVTDWNTRGLRIRLRNIQVDGTEIFEKLFTDVKNSYGRFSSFYVGEIYINPEKVIPNARRDGFEENPDWIRIKDLLSDAVCEPLAKDAYEASKNRQSDIVKVMEDIDGLIQQSEALTSSSRASYDQVVDLMTRAKRLRRLAASRLKLMDDIEELEDDGESPRKRLTAESLIEATKNVEDVESQARLLIGQFVHRDDRNQALRQRLRQEIIAELLEIVSPFVDPTTYQKIKRQLKA